MLDMLKKKGNCIILNKVIRLTEKPMGGVMKKGGAMKKKTERSVRFLFAIMMLESLAANFVHPITPTIIKNLALPDYMFGLAFAGMAFTNFLFSPFWGKLSQFVASRKLLMVSCTGYAIGQMMFCLTGSQAGILAARLVSGMFTGGIGVAALVYILDQSSEESQGKNLVVLAAIQSVGAAFGYLIGGVLGVYTIRGTFYLQSATLFLSGIMFFFLLSDNEGRRFEKVPMRTLAKDANPARAFMDSKLFMTRVFAILFAASLFANLGTYAFDQCFNYYLKDQFGFSSAYNGLLKAVVGFITLAANSTLCMWLIRHTKIRRATSLVLTGCAVCVVGIVCFKELVPFILVCLLLFAFNAVYVPLLQFCVAVEATPENNNLVMGFFNAMKSLGMIGGALVAGFLYGAGAKLPFVFAGVCFLTGAVFLVVKVRRSGSYT